MAPENDVSTIHIKNNICISEQILKLFPRDTVEFFFLTNESSLA